MNAEVKNAVTAAEARAQYDECAKRLLGNKYILANILIRTVRELKGMRPGQVVPLIEGGPYIGAVPVEPGLTNAEKEGQRISGLNAEHMEINEGLVRFDIICYVRMKNGLSQIIVNVEMQKNTPSEYKLLNRAVFYACRMISSQKERDFVNTNYDDIKQVHSIWVCANMAENCMKYVHLTGDNLLGSDCWEGGTDLINIVLIGLSEEIPEQGESCELHRLLGSLLSSKLNAQQKLDIMKTEYDVPTESTVKKEVNVMCNLGEGIWEKGVEQGLAQGLEQGLEQGLLKGREENMIEVITNMNKKGFSLNQISDILDKPTVEIRKILEQKDTSTSN